MPLRTSALRVLARAIEEDCAASLRDDVERYHNDGYVIVRIHLFSAAEADVLRRHRDRPARRVE